MPQLTTPLIWWTIILSITITTLGISKNPPIHPHPHSHTHSLTHPHPHTTKASTSTSSLKQHNIFNMKGVTNPTILSNTTLSNKKHNQITILSISTLSSDSYQLNDWFFGFVQNIPKFVTKLYEEQRAKKEKKHKESHLPSCQLRILALGYYNSFYGQKKKKHVYEYVYEYEGGLATVRVKVGQHHVTLPCFYVTGRNQHFVLVDDPHTIAVAIMCDVTSSSVPITASTSLCDSLYSAALKLRVHLFPSDVLSYSQIASGNSTGAPNLYGLARTFMAISPASSLSQSSKQLPTRNDHAVCTVQTFKNNISGIQLYMFAAYYLEMGYTVIIYDRFGNHYDFIKPFLSMHCSTCQLKYHPYTALQLALPHIYNLEYADNQSEDYVLYFSRHITDKSKQTAMSEVERMTQDQDKRRTYDMSRLTYSQIGPQLFVDSDELLFCPTASSLNDQQQAQHRMIMAAASIGYDEIQVPRVSQFSRRPSSSLSAAFNSHLATETAITCMHKAYYMHNKSLSSLFNCWSASNWEDKVVNPKSIDICGRCPFRYNHYSCAIHKSYRREKYRCHCHVKKIDVNECRIVHLNNKFIKEYLSGDKLAERERLLLEPYLQMSGLWG